MTVSQKLVDLLAERGWHITFAESCTGGLAAATLICAGGASRVLDGSFVVYAPSAKSDLVNVDACLIEENGVVSEAVAEAMAVGAANRMQSQVGVGITGYAGPDGGDGKPAGTVCFGFYINGKTVAQTVYFAGERNAVRRKAANHALRQVLSFLKSI
jgi:PncC family amidohydrolase